MKPSEIEVGRTYRNRGAGLTTRTVLAIDKKLKAPWWSYNPAPNEPVVLYTQDGVESTLYLRSFARWAGGVSSEEV